ncbi:hypothetical protein BD413DRAFT_674980 [Trametes elegans]|nr:hypothetical protein BD413DRAFT_674980 [Trametes elegans]
MASNEALTPGSISQDLSASYGAILSGSLLSYAAWGISCVQLVFYCSQHQQRDSLTVQAFVVTLWLLDTITQFLNIASIWPILITGWGSVEALTRQGVTALHRTWIAAIITSCVQVYYFWRIYRFEKKRIYFLVALIPISIGQVAMTAVALGMNFRNLSRGPLHSKNITTVEVVTRALTALLDVSIMVLMVDLLLRHRHSELSRTRQIISRLIVLTVNTGVWTALAAITEFVLMLAYPDGLQFSVIEFFLSSLYLNALLANLNSREHAVPLREDDSGEVPLSVHTRNRAGRAEGTRGIYSYSASNIAGSGTIGQDTPSSTAVKIHEDSSMPRIDVQTLPVWPRSRLE